MSGSTLNSDREGRNRFSRAALSTSATTGGNGGVLVEHTMQTGSFTDITRRMSMQSSMDVESMLRTDLAVAMATAIDYAAYYGPGTEYMPKGITNHDGINAVAFATPWASDLRRTGGHGNRRGPG
ncbi:phage major capsid protein [Xanthomonas campestris pv. campestris]|uniref:phage major capsid protein n=1 Tax=Xanthomonas campestris TaxID=339 RepID=UPI00388D7EF0